MRKNNLLGIAMFVLMGTMAMTFFTSCDDDDEATATGTVVLPSNVKFSLDNFWSLVANGEYLTLDEVTIDSASTSEGLSIERVDYYFDDELISSSSASPFSLRYLIQDKSVGEHQLTLVIEVNGGEKYSDTSFTFNYSVYVLEEPFALTLNPIFDNEDIASNRVVRNGDTLSGHLEIAENTIDAVISRVEFYWDDNLFASTSISPYKFTYNVENETAGYHVFKFIAYADSPYISSMTVVKAVTINVTE